MRVRAEGLTYRIGQATLLHDVGLEAPERGIVAVVGPNGSGKSTMLRLLYRALEPQRGTVWIGDELLWDLPRKQAACLIGAVPQHQPSEFELTVVELVRLGRLPHQRLLSPTSHADNEHVAKAMEATGVAHLAERHLDQLSGGERQRAVVARALAQDPAVLLLDEPTNHLDVRYQQDLLALLAGLDLTTIVALHDLNLAAAYCDRAIVLSQGSVHAAGPVREVLVPEIVDPAFGVETVAVNHPSTGVPQLLFKPRHHKENT